MRIIKFEHACVRIEHVGQVIVLDPGAFTSREAVDGATAVLLTHEHADHLDVGHLSATDAPIYTIGAVRGAIADVDPEVAERVQVVTPGQHLDVGVPATVVGERHAVIHADVPVIANSGFLLDVGGVSIYHPGDAFDVPDAAVDLLLLPFMAPWSKTAEVVDFARSVGAPRSLAVHDGLLGVVGLQAMGRIVGGLLDTEQHTFTRVEPGSDVPV